MQKRMGMVRGAFVLFVLPVVLIGCSRPAVNRDADGRLLTLREARATFTTTIVREDPPGPPPERPPLGSGFTLVEYDSPVGPLPAYVTTDPQDGERHPAIVWITGGDCNTIGDVWSPQPYDNDQSVPAFRRNGIVMMFPSLRGGNQNPGRREGFYGEVDDVLAAADYLASLPYVDPERIYLGGHSTGGTLAMLVGEYSDRFRAVFAFGPVAEADQYGGEFIYCDLGDVREIGLRSPIHWLHCVEKPMYVFEGDHDGNWYGGVDRLLKSNENPNIRFFKIAGHDHFSVLSPVTEIIARKIAAGDDTITEADLAGIR